MLALVSRKKLALLVGVGNSIGMLGAVGAEGPLSFAVENFGWRVTVNAFGFIGLFLAVILYVFIRKEPVFLRETNASKYKSSLQKQMRSQFR